MTSELIQSFEKYSQQQLGFLTEPVHLYEPFQYIFSIGGKRLRPIALMTTGFAMKARQEILLPAALSTELFHNFSLMHDDIMDEADMRRGQASVPHKYGRDIAILSGDAMLIKAYEELTLSAKRSKAGFQIIDDFNKMALAVCEGQQMDMDFEARHDVTMEEYIEMIGKKTAALFAYCLQCGASLSRADRSEAMKLFRIGMNAGVAFQIMDDRLDFYGDQIKVGKKKGGDILQGKKSALVLAALEQATPDDTTLLMNLLHDGDMAEDQKLRLAAEIFTRNKAEDRLNVIQAEYWTNACEELDELIINYPKLSELKIFLNKLLVRDH